MVAKIRYYGLRKYVETLLHFSQFFKSFTAQAFTAVIFGAAFGAKVTFMVVLVSMIEEDITILLRESSQIGGTLCS